MMTSMQQQQAYDRMKAIQEALRVNGNLDEIADLCRDFLQDYNQGQEVLKVAELLIKLRPKDALSYILYGVVCYNNKDYKPAEGAYLRAITLEPNNGMAIMNLGNLYYVQGFLPEAQRYFERSIPFISEQNKMVAYLNLASLYADRKQKDKAVSLLSKANAGQVRDAGLKALVGNIYYAMGMEEMAKTFFRHAVDANLKNEKVHLYLAKINENRNDFEQVKKDIQTAYAITREKYGDDFSQWPQEKDWHDIYYMYQLYHGDADSDRHIFTNCNLDDKLADNPESIHAVLDERRVIAELNDMYLVGNGWTLFNKQKELFFNLSFSVNMVLSEGNHTANFFKVDSRQGISYTKEWDMVEEIDEPVIIMGGAKNYYHWLCDYLPRLAMLEKQDKTLAALPILINGNLTDFQKESLGLLGFDRTRLRFIDDEKIYHLKQAYLLHLTGRPLMPHNTPDWMNPGFRQMDAQWLRRRFAPWMKPQKDNPKRLFLSRRNADFRKCLNEDKVLELAKQYGFEEVRNEERSFADQIALYAGADAVMGVHGAGFANMVFAPEGATLIELHAKDDLPAFYTNMTAILNQNHIPVAGTVIQSLRPMAYSFWNFSVDIDALKAVLDKTFG